MLEPVEIPAAGDRVDGRRGAPTDRRPYAPHHARPGTSGRRALLLLLGPEPAATWDRQTDASLRARALAWVEGMVTPSGRDRALAIASCGRPQIALYGGEPVIAAQRCRDRACPRCQRLLARETAAELRPVVDARARRGECMYFVTLTLPKPPTDDPSVALDAIRDAWRRWTNRKTRAGRIWHEQHAGALRAIEITWSPKGATRKDGSIVPYDGWHAHIHAIVSGGSMGAMLGSVRRFCEMNGADPGAQCVKLLDEARVGQLCKYVAKPLHACPTHLARLLYDALDRRRMLTATGSWRGWRDEIVCAPESPIAWSQWSPAKLLSVYGNKAEREDTTLVFVEPAAAGDVFEWTVPDVVAALRRTLWAARKAAKASQAPPDIPD